MLSNVEMTYREAVLFEYRDAVAWMNPDTGEYCIFRYSIGAEQWRSLSASCPTEDEAWRDAAQSLKKRSEP